MSATEASVTAWSNKALQLTVVSGEWWKSV